MKHIFKTLLFTFLIFSFYSCGSKPKINIELPEKYEGEKVEIINYLDSTILAEAIITNGIASIEPASDKPTFNAVVIDGKTRAFYISEPGTAQLTDSLSSAYGTPLNDKFNVLLNQLDSVEQYDDMDLYIDFVKQKYEENISNPIGEYFGLELIRYGEGELLTQVLNNAPEHLKNSKKALHYIEMAKLREATGPGKQYVDFEGEDENGKTVNLSQYIKPGEYTLVDFWASWCPYCIKELPDLKALREEYSGKGLNIIGVAVRDLPDDTKGAVQKHEIPWTVIYNTQRKPYDIYGFAGIPHHILIGPDGKIISRGENVAQIKTRLEKTIK